MPTCPLSSPSRRASDVQSGLARQVACWLLAAWSSGAVLPKGTELGDPRRMAVDFDEANPVGRALLWPAHRRFAPARKKPRPPTTLFRRGGSSRRLSDRS